MTLREYMTSHAVEYSMAESTVVITADALDGPVGDRNVEEYLVERRLLYWRFSFRVGRGSLRRCTTMTSACAVHRGGESPPGSENVRVGGASG